VVDHGDGPIGDDHLDRLIGPVELARVVEQAGHGAMEARRCPITMLRRTDHDDRVRPVRRSNLAATSRATSSRSTRLEHLVGVGAARDGHDLVDELGQLVGLGLEVGEDRIAVATAHRRVALERIEVRLQARERGPELVAGVLDQPLLVVPGTPEGGEHPIERRAEPTDLVVTGTRPR
jgi:hypothetical protein